MLCVRRGGMVNEVVAFKADELVGPLRIAVSSANACCIRGRVVDARSQPVHRARVVVSGALKPMVWGEPGDPADPDVAAAVTARPTVELSKVYVMPEQHGAGVAAALMDASVAAARETGAVSVWLGVNTQNARANRFYDKSGFRIVGAKKFRLGDVDEDDFVRERTL